MGDTDVHALAGVDLDVKSGEFISITGASGSGKSTFMHLLGCLEQPTSGTYELDGRSVTELNEKELARIRNRRLGFVFQTFNLINRTSALDNVAIPLMYARETGTNAKAMSALDRVGLAPRAKHTPGEMSGGERQRVAIARAIVNNPSVIFADEPTGNLDSHTGQQILDIFAGLHAEGTTIILVTHETSVAVQAKRLVHMIDGKIAADTWMEDAIRRGMFDDSMNIGGKIVGGSPASARSAV